MTAAPLLELRNIARVFGNGPTELVVFRGLSLSVRPGELVALVGPSGAGKSSLLHIAGLLEAPSSGAVLFNGRDCAGIADAERTRIRREMLGFVYQYHHLLPEFSAVENVMMPQRIAGVPRAAAHAEAARLLALLGLGRRLDHWPGQLSGGEQQRVAIARALANKPRLLLADEPTGNLDPRTAQGVFEALTALVRNEGLAALVATHNLQLASRMDRALVLHEGRLIDGAQLVETGA